MKSQTFFATCVVIILSVLVCNRPTFASTPSDTVVAETIPIDTTKEDYPHYKNVDVEINYQWSDPEVEKGVDVALKLENGKPQSIFIIHDRQKQCEIFLRQGVVIKIFDRNTGKVIKTLKG
jgi:hypothetical protein